MKISACMITKNEGSNIARCIESYREIVDEVIIVDTGSTDDTVDIAKSYDAKVYFREWDNDFASAKNYALDHATGDWIIFLDSDEFFDASSLSKLKNILWIADKDPSIDAIENRIYNIDESNNKLLDHAPIIRIFRNLKGIRFSGKIHEALIKEGKYLRSLRAHDIKIYHTGYSTDKALDKVKRNLEILEENLRKSENVPNITYFYLCESYYNLKRYKDTIQYADIFLNKIKGEKTGLKTPNAFRVYLYKSLSMMNLKKDYSEEEVYNTILIGIKEFPNHPEVKTCEADILMYQGKKELALAAYKEALQMHEKYDQYYSNNFQNSIDNVLNNIGAILALKNCEIQALDYFIKALSFEKYNESVFKNMMDIIKNQAAKEIIGFLNSFYDINAPKDLDFLTLQLARLKLKTPFYYYFTKLNKTNQHADIYPILALFLNNDTEKVINLIYPIYLESKEKQYEILLILSLICGEHRQWYYNHIEDIPQVYRRFLKDFFQFENYLDYSDEEKDAFLNILAELIPMENEYYAENFINRLKNLKNRFAEEIANLFLKNKKYDKATYHYQNAIIKELDISRNVICYFCIGYCYYKKGNYFESLNYFESALLNGYEDINQILEFISWIREKAENEELFNKTNEIIKQHMKRPVEKQYIN